MRPPTIGSAADIPRAETTRPDLDTALWYSSYVPDLFKRDVRALRQIGDLGEYQRFLEMTAARNAQLLDLTALSRDLGLAINTIKAWTRILETSFSNPTALPVLPQPGKTARENTEGPISMKQDSSVIFWGCAMRRMRCRARRPADLWKLPYGVNCCVHFQMPGEQPRVHFWRTTKGEEVDFIVEWKGRLVPIEVKLTKTPGSMLAQPIEEFCDLFSPEAPEGIVVCWVDQPVTLSRRCRAIPFRELPFLFH